jgi:hypothetical protein
MYMQAFIVRFVFVGVFGLGIVLSTAFRHPEAQAAAMPATTATSPASVATSPVPPTVTLSTVHVTAGSPHIVVARIAHADPALAAHATTSEAGGHGGLAPTLRLDMPYYSFGKMVPRVGKE